MLISNLEPSLLWSYFEDICKIPRLSKNEDKIRLFLKDFAKKNKLEVQEDKVGNILITKEADPGYEDRKSIVLQSHMDMVGEKDADTEHDWLNDPIIPIIEDGWVTARITTLGADDGIGMAAQMALITDKNIKSGKIESLFTVDEESGMTGAIKLEPGFFDSSILINLDSEDEGELFIGCAGGQDTLASFEYSKLSAKPGDQPYMISVTGLHGGHSGDEIHNGYANSVKIITEVLTSLNSKFGVDISTINAGNLRNAIPREAFTLIYTGADPKKLKDAIKDLETEYRKEFEATEPNMSFSLKPSSGDARIMKDDLKDKLLRALSECPHGVIAWSESMEGLVETSTNLASVKTDGDLIRIVTSQRSSVEEAKKAISEKIAGVFRENGASVKHTDGYPGWEPNTESEILKITAESYRTLFNTEPVIRAIHAGLECGLILEKYPGLDMISFGPTIKGAHTPEEKLNIETTLKFWDLLIDVVRNIPEN